MTAARPRRAGARRAARGALLAVAVVAGSAGSTGCQGDCCTVDSLPIPLARAPRGDGDLSGGLLARAAVPGGPPFQMVVDTASPVTIVSGAAIGLTPISGALDLLDETSAGDRPVRARFRNIGIFALPLGAQGDAATRPSGVLGGDLLRSFSLELRFGPSCPPGAPLTPGCATATFWRHQGASTGFLSDANYAVLRFALMGGGETTARTSPDAIGLTAPVTLPSTRIVLRACAAPRVFSTTELRETCCKRGDEIGLGTGVDLSLVLATGAGPLVLSEAAWAPLAVELARQGTAPPEPTPALLHMASWPTPIPARWSTLPRYALVDLEAGTSADPGPCVELARARRIEWLAHDQQAHPAAAACVQLCDTDVAEAGKAQNSAAYLELGGAIPVAIVSDVEPYLQALRFDVRPEGPEVDGLVGAGALGGTRLELDYLSDPPRAIFSCEDGVADAACHSASRCPRLPDNEQKHLCFGLPAHSLPLTCTPSGC